MTTKTVRSGLMLLALTGMLAACSSGSDAGGSNTRANRSESTASSVVQRASVTIASVTDADGRVVPMESSSVLGQLKTIDRAEVSKEVIKLENGALGERHVVDLRDAGGSIVKFHSMDFETAKAAANFPATAELQTAEGRITQMLVHVEDGGTLNVVLAFGAEQDEPKQDVKQDEPKQDEPKQDEPKQDEPKQDEPKQDEPKQDEPKQDEPKQDEPKQDEPKQDEPKQDEPKQSAR